MTAVPGQVPRFHVEGAVARITLGRPQHRNRLHDEDLAALLDHFERIGADRAIRVVVLQAEVLPERPVFSAGYHTGEFENGPAAAQFEPVMDALEALRPVTICALNGSVYGGATDIPLACDLTVAAEGIEMRMPAAALGLHYYPNGLARYVSRLGVNVAKRAFLTAQAFDDQALLRIGYVQELVPPAALVARVDALAAQVAALAPLALETLKQSLNELARGEHDRERLFARWTRTQASEDFAEGRRAFSERRPPLWKGR